MAKRIRDTLYGYVYLTWLEEAVSQHPYVLRLHYVHQTSFTYLTYPNAHSTRYPHSLGVMHVVGDLFRAALINSDADTLVHLFDFVRTTTNAESVSLEEIHKELKGKDQSRLLRNALYQSILRASHRESALTSDKIPESLETELFPVAILVLYQSIRLAAMLHDIGHPPFSHIVEYGLREALGSAYPGHEDIGYSLLESMLTDESLNGRSAFQRAPTFCLGCLTYARAILRAKKGEHLFGLKDGLISGELDADRLDYVRRDCYAAGLVPQYDIRRLVDSAYFRKMDGRQEIRLEFSPGGLSAIENFFSARYELYRWMIYFHDVVRRNLAVQRLIGALLDPQTTGDVAVQVAKEIRGMASTTTSDWGAGYGRFVDSYLLDAFWRIDSSLRAAAKAAPLSTHDERIQYYLNIVLHRRNDLLRTLIKRSDQYDALAEKVGPRDRLMHLLTQNGTGRAAAERTKQLEGALTKNATYQLNTLLQEAFHDRFPKEEERARGRVKFAREIEDAISSKADTKFVRRLHGYYHGTFRAGPSLETSLRENYPGAPSIPLHQLSPTVAMLQDAWNYSPHLAIFYEPQHGVSEVDAKRQRDNIEGAVIEGMKSFLEIST